MKKIKVKMNKTVYLGLPMLKISKTLLYEFWYDYINPKYQDNAKLKMFMKILLMTLKKDSIHQIMMLIDHCLQEKNEKVIGLMKNELRGKVMIEFVAIRSKTYSYLMDDGNSNKKWRNKKV